MQGTLSIGAAALDSAYVLGIDVDPDALKLARENIEEAECTEAVCAHPLFVFVFCCCGRPEMLHILPRYIVISVQGRMLQARR